MKTFGILPTLLLLHAISFSQIGKDGNVVITTTQVVNEYTYLQADVAPGDFTITVNNSGMNTSGTFSGPLEPGDLVMIIQVQGATIQGGVNTINWGNILDYNSCGLYEFKEIEDVPDATHIEFTCPVENSYQQSGHVQVVRVPRYNTLTVDGGTITSLNWDGLRGGVVAIEVNGLTSLINGGEIDVTGQGFRGGIMDNQSSYGFMNFYSNSQTEGGEKGESIAGFGPEYTPLGGRFGRGAPANGGGGGNAHNSGGGGGANAGNQFPWNGMGNPDNSNPAWTDAWNLEGGGFAANQSCGGGRGGYTYSGANQNAIVSGPGNPVWGGDQRRNTGGIGGRALDYSTGRLFLGGGGGAGDGNNGAGTNGASGGGMVFLLTYDNIVGTGQILASGQSAPTTPPNGNDAPGGGGGGGTIVISTAGTVSATLTCIANGGDGGDQFILTNEAEGPGGGGGGGYIAFSAGAPATIVNGGANGTTNSLGVTEFSPNGATAGGDGMTSSQFQAPFTMTVAAMDDSICAGQSATLTAAAANPAYNGNILWFDAPYGGNLLASGPTYSTPNLFATTTYYIKVCPAFYVDSVTVTVGLPPVISVTADSTTCNGVSNGTAEASGVLPTYSYAWSNGQTGLNATNLSVGNHSVTATTPLGCSTTINFAINEPAPLGVNFNESPALCFDDPTGSLSATASGGTAPYSYSWVSPSTTGTTITNVSAGNYTVTITDNNGCVMSADGTVTEPTAVVASITALTNASCNGSADGDVLITPSGGTAPHTIDWPALTGDAFFMDNLPAGNYVAEVSDNNGCTASVVATIAEPDVFSVVIDVLADETCSYDNGSAYASVTGGIGVLAFDWTPDVSSSNTANGLSAGPVSVVVTDENGCTAAANGNIIDYATGTGSIASMNPVTCVGGSNGNITVEMTGGTAPFDYFWSCACPDTNTATGLVAGNYSVDIFDAHGCHETIFFVMDELPALLLDTVAVTGPLCAGDVNGSAEVAASGGTGPYHFMWNTTPPQASALATNLSSGTYSVTVTDANNCENNMTIDISQPSALAIQTDVLSNILCHGDSAGVASVTASGGSAPYQYQWSTTETTDTIDNLMAGFYYVMVTDNNNCSVQDTVEIVEYHQVTAQLIGDSLFCPGDLVHFYVLTNGMNNLYDYHWSVNGFLQSTQNDYSIPIYSETEVVIELVHQDSCPGIQDTIIVSPIKIDPAVLDVLGTTDTICYGSSGVVQATISDWSYITAVYWSELALTGTGPHLVTPSDDHYYVVTIENSCNESIQDSVLLNVFLPPAANIYASATEGCGEVNALFGFDCDTALYDVAEVNWHIYNDDYSGPAPVVHIEHSMDLTGNMNLTFTNGCSFNYKDSVAITVWDVPVAGFYYKPEPAQQYELTEFVDISHGNPVAWEWYIEGAMVSTDERPTYIFDEIRNFSVTEIITNEFGCTDTAHLMVEVIGDFAVFIPNAFTPDGNGYNNVFKPVMTNVKPDNYQFLVFDRWGEVIFSANELDAAWNGEYKGALVQDGVYVYQVHVTDNLNERHEYLGHVTLLK